MKKLAMGLVASLFFLSVSFAAPKASQKGKAFSGEIMDSQCAKLGSHDMMMKKEGAKDAKECTLNCVKMGGKYVLYNAATKTVYELDDQKKPEEFAGQKVKVTGTYNKTTKTLHVTDIKPAS